ncbi:hypothetical protein Scep_007864 [Stephania cephalantha]|uniref:Uncharacterized protein n=1 Tax=Stephania cephalantha TaxID=152367 RepID=A0AAP0PM64_9MAGN
MRVTNTQEREKRPDSSSGVGSRRSNGGAPSRQDRAGIDGVETIKMAGTDATLQPTRTVAGSAVVRKTTNCGSIAGVLARGR